MQILPEEVFAIEAALQWHSKAQNYRVNVRHDCIEVYELVGRSAEDLIAALARRVTIRIAILDHHFRSELARSATQAVRQRLALLFKEGVGRDRTIGARTHPSLRNQPVDQCFDRVFRFF